MRGSRFVLVECCLLVVLMLVISGCADRETIRIGFMAGLSGPTSDLGVEGRRGVQLAIEEWSERHAGEAPRVELLSWDDRQDPSLAREGFAHLRDQGVRILIGPFTSEMCVALLPEVKRNKILVLSPTASTPAVGGQDDHFLRTYTSSTIQASQIASYIHGNTSVRRLRVVIDARNLAHGQPYATVLAKAFADAGGECLALVEFGRERHLNLAVLAEEILAEEPDGVFIIANALDTAQICQQLAKRRQDLALFGSEWSSSPQLAAFGGSAVEGFRFVQTVDLDDTNEQYQVFVHRYLDRFGRAPGFVAVLAYDSTQIILSGLRSVREEELRDWILQQKRFPTLHGEVEFDATGDCVRSAHVIQIIDGRFERILKL